MKEFPPFRLDTVQECLWRRDDGGGDEYISLAPKPFAVLKYLVEHAGHVVSQDELLDALWPATFVQPAVLKTHILDVRNALSDSARNSRFIETLPRQGYRFIAPVSEPATAAKFTPKLRSGKLVGRDAALAELRNCLERTQQDHREIVFVTGEPGIGKTALVDEFLRRATTDFRGQRMARGQCVEGYGSQEAYYPMLEALGELCTDSGGDAVVQTLSAQAPTWLVQFPALVKHEERQKLQREILGATRERMLREIAEALETITSERPLLLVLEDLQWVDPSTVDLISALARRRQPAKLMLIGTYRPAEIALSDQPLKALKPDLLIHHLCHEIALEPLGKAEVAEYLEAEAGGAATPKGLSEVIYRHTEGNPLFMVAALDHMRDRGVLAVENGAWQIKAPLEKIDLGAPDSLRQMIEFQIEQLSTEERLALEVMSVLRKFPLSVAIGSAVANIDPETFEDSLERLARRHQVIRPAAYRFYRSECSLSPFYEFVHVLYRQALYSWIGTARRRKLHRRMGEAAEALHVFPEPEGLTELAYQFEEGGDWLRAVKYLQLAADTAGRRFETRQAAGILEHVLELANRIEGTERAQAEVGILGKLAAIYSSSFDPRAVPTYEALAARAIHYGLADVEVRALLEMVFPLATFAGADEYMRALGRAHQVLSRFRDGDTLKQTWMRALYLCRRTAAGKWDPGDLEECRNLAAKIREADGDRRLLGEVQLGCGYALLLLSEYREARRSAEEGFAILLEGYEENPYLSFNFQLYEHLVCSCLLFQGEWGQALRKTEQRVEMVEKNADRQSAIIAGLERVWLQIQAMDFTGAQQFLESAVPTLAVIPTVWRTCLILAGEAEAGLGNHDRALEHLLQCSHEIDKHPMMRDWYHRMPLQRALAEVWLCKGELEKASAEAKQFLKVTLATEERTFRALAFETNARVAIAMQELDRAQDCVAKALRSMEGYEVPLAAWRVHSTASELYRHLGNRELADSHREFSRATILKLANSLPSDEPMRKTFLAAPMIRKILENVAVPSLPI